MVALSEKNFQSASHSASGIFFTTITELVIRVARTRHERKQLANLSESQLRDIGISKSDAMQESKRALLDLPAHRW